MACAKLARAEGGSYDSGLPRSSREERRASEREKESEPKKSKTL